MLKNGIDVARSTVGVQGITFKENCPDIRNSKVIDLVRELEGWGVKVVVTDPWADADDLFHKYGIYLGEINSKNPVDALIVAVGHNEFRRENPAELRAFCRGDKPVLGDLKALFDRHAAETGGFTVFRL